MPLAAQDMHDHADLRHLQKPFSIVGSNKPINKSIVVLLPLPVVPISLCARLDRSPDAALAIPQVVRAGNENAPLPDQSCSGVKTVLTL